MRGDESYEACGTSGDSARMTTTRRDNYCGKPLHRALVMRRRIACLRLPRHARCSSVATSTRRCPQHATTHARASDRERYAEALRKAGLPEE